MNVSTCQIRMHGKGHEKRTLISAMERRSDGTFFSIPRMRSLAMTSISSGNTTLPEITTYMRACGKQAMQCALVVLDGLIGQIHRVGLEGHVTDKEAVKANAHRPNVGPLG